MPRRRLLLILLLFLVLRGLLAAWTWGVRGIFPDAFPEDPAPLYKGVAIEPNPWLEPWQRWDTPQYQAIAERGYAAFDTAYFTPPLFPYLMRWTAPLFGGNTLSAGLFVSGLAFLGCLLAIYPLARLELGEESAAMRTVVYLAFFPAAVFLAAAYSESLFLLGAILCLYFLRKEQWLAAGLAGGFAALARIPGTLLFVPLAYAAWQAWKKGNRRGWLALAAMGLVLAAWYTSQWFSLGQPHSGILTAQGLRGGYLTIPGLNILEAARRIVAGQLVIENSLELAFTLAFIVFTVFIWKKLPRVYGLYAASLMLFFLSRMGSPQPLVSMARYCLEVFPVFLLLAAWGARPWVNRLILYISWIGLLFFSAQFAIWGWVG
jgi:4-amino-4-deoxy-L-arabinose transferase-like glycosyltransferase